MLFMGEKFESVPALKLARSLLLDMFRGEQVRKGTSTVREEVQYIISARYLHY